MVGTITYHNVWDVISADVNCGKCSTDCVFCFVHKNGVIITEYCLRDIETSIKSDLKCNTNSESDAQTEIYSHPTMSNQQSEQQQKPGKPVV